MTSSSQKPSRDSADAPKNIDINKISWTEAGKENHAAWRSESGVAPPKRVTVADDTMAADAAFRLASEGNGLLWRGDFQNARHLLQALMRRTDRAPRTSSKKARDRTARAAAETSLAQTFHLHRQSQSQRARTLSMVLIPLDGDYSIPLRRAPDIKLACNEAWGPASGKPSVVSLRELLGLVGAHEWRKKGVEVPALGTEETDRIHPYYGVFSPVRGEYVELIAQTELPSTELAFDIGVGTGVLAAVLARRGVQKIVGTDTDARAISCAKENLKRLDVLHQVELQQVDLFPAGRAPLIVCNPPWVPARASSPIERAIFDEDSRMLKGFLGGLREHLSEGGEGWLVLSDFAEHLGLRSREQLLEWIAAGGLEVIEKLDVKPSHPRVQDESDPLHKARAAETTSLWRLKAA